MDYAMLRTLEHLAERPLEYELQHPIRAIERAVASGLAQASEPYRAFLGKKPRWKIVRKVTLSDAGTRALAAGETHT